MTSPGAPILVVRNDKIGDFMLAYRSLCLLKSGLPDHRIVALVTGYASEMAEICPWVDDIIVDPGRDAGLRGFSDLVARIRTYGFAAAIILKSTTRIGLTLYLAGIPYRLAPATKLAQLFYSHRLLQRRSQSIKPEHDYNADLVRHYLKTRYGLTPEDPGPPYLSFGPEITAEAMEQLERKHEVDTSKPVVFLHSGSGGSASNLSLVQYQMLARQLQASADISLVLTAGPGEMDRLNALQKGLDDVPHVVLESTEGLRRFAQYISCASVFISGSTGPLHIAGALDVPTAAFYPRRRSSTRLRWQTLNSEGRRLSFAPPETAGESEMEAIDVDHAAELIVRRLLTLDAR